MGKIRRFINRSDYHILFIMIITCLTLGLFDNSFLTYWAVMLLICQAYTTFSFKYQVKNFLENEMDLIKDLDLWTLPKHKTNNFKYLTFFVYIDCLKRTCWNISYMRNEKFYDKCYTLSKKDFTFNALKNITNEAIADVLLYADRKTKS